MTTLTTAKTTLDTAVTTFNGTVVTNSTVQQVALANVTTALADIATAIAAPGTPTAAEYTAVLDALANNATVLGLSLTDFNALSATDKEDVIDALSALTISTPATLNSAIATEVVNVLPARISSVELTDDTTLTITFNKAVTIATATGNVEFTSSTGSTGVADFTAIGGTGTATIAITLDGAAADALDVGSTIDAIVDGTGAAITFTANGKTTTLSGETVVAP